MSRSADQKTVGSSQATDAGDARAQFFAAAPSSPVDLSVRIGSLRLANPIMPASGCFGPELAPLVPLAELGALVTKTVFAQQRAGNPAHRLTETPTGMINSVGIPSQGTSGFLQRLLPRYLSVGVPVVVSMGGLGVREYWTAVEELGSAGHAALELNVSCPNLDHGGLEIGTDCALVEQVVSGVVQRTDLPVLVKLTPTVTSIADVARAAEQAGASAVTVANSFPGLVVDAYARKPVLGNGIGGTSGPAIKALALRLVWQAARAVSIPVIGCGGISCARDVLEFLVAGASAVQIGTATFARPYAMVETVRDLARLCARWDIERVRDVVGTLRS